MRVHNCGHVGCHNKILMSERYCSEHIADGKRYQSDTSKRISNRYYNHYKRDPEANAFYHDKRWIAMRDYVYARDIGICQCCGEVLTDRKIVDHIHPLKIASDERLSADNLWTLCYQCHSIKTMIEEQTISRPNGTNKLKHMTKQWYIKQIMRLRNKQLDERIEQWKM